MPRPVRLFAGAAAAILLSIPAAALAEGGVLLMHDAAQRESLRDALRAELSSDGIEVDGLDRPPGDTFLQRAAAAQAEAARREAAAALWVEQDGPQAPVLHIVTPDSAQPRSVPLPGPWATVQSRVFAVIAAHALRGDGAHQEPPSRRPPSEHRGEEPPSRRPPSEQRGEPSAAERLTTPRPAPGARPVRSEPPRPEPAGTRGESQPYPPVPEPPGAAPVAPESRAASYPPPAARPALPRGDRKRSRRARKERSPWRHPQIPRDDWRLLVGPVFGGSPRVDETGFYEPSEIYGLRVMLATYIVDFVRFGVVGSGGGAPGYGPYGTLGASLMYTNVKSLFRFGVGMNVSAIVASDQDDGDQFGWFGVEIFPAVELGWELSESWGLVMTGGITMTKPGDEDFVGGGQFAIEVEVGL